MALDIEKSLQHIKLNQGALCYSIGIAMFSIVIFQCLILSLLFLPKKLFFTCIILLIISCAGGVFIFSSRIQKIIKLIKELTKE